VSLIRGDALTIPLADNTDLRDRHGTDLAVDAGCLCAPCIEHRLFGTGVFAVYDPRSNSYRPLPNGKKSATPLHLRLDAVIHRLRLNPFCFLCRKQWRRLIRTGHWMVQP
jgi:hypothetical protein